MKLIVESPSLITLTCTKCTLSVPRPKSHVAYALHDWLVYGIVAIHMQKSSDRGFIVHKGAVVGLS